MPGIALPHDQPGLGDQALGSTNQILVSTNAPQAEQPPLPTALAWQVACPGPVQEG
jgi:hypothetical protein